MGEDVELSLRGPQAYGLAGRALAAMQQQEVWPTPLNYELWLHYVGDPQGELGAEIDRLIRSGAAITEAISEQLAARFLPKTRLNDEIRDAGDQLTRQLESISLAIQSAQKSNVAYGKTLAGASAELAEGGDGPALKRLVEGLATATRRMQRETGALERRLHASTEEVSNLREHLAEVRREAMTDALTTLANRKAFDEGLAAACKAAEAEGRPLCLAVIDIDHFKVFNDTWGHQTGDQVIRYVASVIGRAGAPPRLAARYGGEEFAIVFPREAAPTAAAELDEIRREIGSRALKRRSTNADLGAVTISVGLAEYRPGETCAALIERADAALYDSKRAGRDRVTVADMDTARAA